MGDTTLAAVLPNRLPWSRHLPGAVLALGFFMVAALVLRTYVADVLGAALPYGALAAPMHEAHRDICAHALDDAPSFPLHSRAHHRNDLVHESGVGHGAYGSLQQGAAVQIDVGLGHLRAEAGALPGRGD